MCVCFAGSCLPLLHAALVWWGRSYVAPEMAAVAQLAQPPSSGGGKNIEGADGGSASSSRDGKPAGGEEGEGLGLIGAAEDGGRSEREGQSAGGQRQQRSATGQQAQGQGHAERALLLC